MKKSRQIVCQQIWDKPACFVKAAEYIERSGPWQVRQWVPLKIEYIGDKEEYTSAADMVCDICYGLCDLEELRVYEPELCRAISDYCDWNNVRCMSQDWMLRKFPDTVLPSIYDLPCASPDSPAPSP